ncbi:hypothetical protein Pcinc_040588 [Petrolisthes cinctipes]|uniref:Uncharacterized protein n=1 Tax=Petrolisthes cinctipes TaxID=88211 RepID=A0AAE1BLY7_PETCI|nr:hypothetical protein Pcinc_040588 [Petrolisthes cinctipes]
MSRQIDTEDCMADQREKHFGVRVKVRQGLVRERSKKGWGCGLANRNFILHLQEAPVRTQTRASHPGRPLTPQENYTMSIRKEKQGLCQFASHHAEAEIKSKKVIRDISGASPLHPLETSGGSRPRDGGGTPRPASIRHH